MTQTLAADPSASTLAAAKVRRWAKPMRDVPVSAAAKTDHITNSNILMMGTMALKIPSPEPEPEGVKPNFRTQRRINVGAISVQVT